MTRTDPGRTPAVVVFVSAAFWGLFWLPQRALAEAGLTGGWATLGQFGLAALLLAPAIVWRALNGRPTGLTPILPTLLIGGGLVLYSNSLLLTSVAHALLLFYLAPAWGTLLELIVLRRRLTTTRAAALAMSLGGLWIVVGAASGVPWPSALGDWLGLFAGMTLTYGQFRLRTGPVGDDLGNLFAMLAYGGVVAGLFVALGGASLGSQPSAAALAGAFPWLVLVTLVFQLAGNVGLIWGAARLDAGRFAILILSDVVVGVGSAALLADEPFGWREAIGWLLIVGAGLMEVVAPQRAETPQSG
ncbi:MAG: DMT family transporter [Alphaproteobacteria bacterium]